MLLRYVSKSKLKQIVDDFNPEENAEKLAMVKNALIVGDPFDPVFFANQCEIWLVYLAIHEDISMDVFLQGYLYLLATKQCIDLDLNILTTQDLQHNDGILTLYAESLATHYPHVTAAEIKQAYLALTGVNSWLTTISTTNLEAARLSTQHSLLFDLDTPPVYPYFKHPEGKNRVTTPIRIIETDLGPKLIIPPVALVQWLIKKYNPTSQIKLIPIFGRLTDVTLYEDFHRLNMHPGNLHSSSFVKNNLLEAHGCYGPFSLAVHDIYYHYVARALIPANIINFFMIVVMQALKELFINEPNSLGLNLMLTVINCLDLPSDTLHPEYMPLNEKKLGSFLADYLMRYLKAQKLKSFDNGVLIKLCDTILKNPVTEFNIDKREFVRDFLSYFEMDSLLSQHSLFPRKRKDNAEPSQDTLIRKM